MSAILFRPSYGDVQDTTKATLNKNDNIEITEMIINKQRAEKGMISIIRVIPYQLLWVSIHLISWAVELYINGLAQDCSYSIANALELLQSCTKPSTWGQMIVNMSNYTDIRAKHYEPWAQGSQNWPLGD